MDGNPTTTGSGEPTDADRALVAREVERLKASAGPTPAGYLGTYTPEHVFYMGWVDILTALDIPEAAAHLRADVLKALKGERLETVMEPAPRRAGWLAQLDDQIRHRSAVRRLNSARVRLGLGKLREPRIDFDEETARNMTSRAHTDWDYR